MSAFLGHSVDIKLAVMTNTFILSALMLAREGASVTATDIR